MGRISVGVMTDDEFKRTIKGTKHYDTFLSQLSDIENTGTSRAEAFQQAKSYVTDLMSGDKPIPADSPDIAVFDPNSVDYGASSDIRRDYLWVNDNYEGEPDWELCPSNGARNLLAQMKDSKIFRQKFLESILPKILPSQTEQSRARRMEDDGRDLSELTKRIQKAYIESMHEARQLVENSGLEWGNDDERA